jgi:hypothetical protein
MISFLEWLRSNVTTLGILLVICTILLIRKRMGGRLSERIAPYRNSLVCEEFYKVCRPSQGRPQIVWILRDYMPIAIGAKERMAHAVNLYLTKIGWKVVVIVPESSINSYEDIPILQFYQKTEIELAIHEASCIFTEGTKVLETASKTALRSRLPLVIFLNDEGLAIKSLEQKPYLVYTSNWIKTVYSELTLNSIVLSRVLNWRNYVTHTTREYITILSNEEENKSLEIVKALPEYNFLGIFGEKNSPLRNLTIWGPQLEERAIYAITGILCCLGSSVVPIQGMTPGIPIIASPTPLAKEILETSGLYATTVDEFVSHIRSLKGDTLFYKKYSELSTVRAKALDPTRQLDEFQAWIQDPVLSSLSCPPLPALPAPLL